MDDFWEIAVPMMALVVAIVVTVVILARLRSRMKPEEEEAAAPLIPSTASRRQRKILEKLEPIPEIPTLMDLVRAEIDELGLEEIPGHEGISGPVLLKVYRRDELVRDRCEHGTYEYRVADGVEPGEALDDDVRLFCEQCGEINGAEALAEPDSPNLDEEQPPSGE